jgi:tetratricopeptide (TPR) repeat protein
LPAVAQPDQATTLESLLAEAHNAQARSDFRSAAGAYRQALAIRPNLPELWSNLGLMQHESGEYSPALESFHKALGLNPSLYVPNLFLGLDLLQLNRPREATTYLLAAEKLNPGDPQPVLALGRAFHKLWEPDKSREWYQRATALVPRNGEAWYGLGLAHFDLAESAGAKLAGSFRESAYAADLTASAFAEQGRLTEAIHAYRALLSSKAVPPRCSHASYGFVLVRHGDLAEAGEEFRRDLESCPAARVGISRVLFDSGAPAKGLAMLADLASSDREGFGLSLPRFWEGLDTQQLVTRLATLRESTGTIADVMLARLREGAGSALLAEPERSVPELRDAVGLQRFASDAFFLGHFRTAAQTSDRLRQRFPNDPAGWYWAVRANQRLGVAALARAGEVDPDSPRIHALLGDLYQRRRMFDEAREEYSKMLAISPASVAALSGLAAAYFAEARLEEAQATAQKALAQNPADSDVNLLMGQILVARREYADAEPYLKQSLQARADLLPHVHALLGNVFARTGRSKEALMELTQGLASDEDGSVHYQLASLYREAGDSKAAAAAFEESRQIRARRDALAQEMLAPLH